MLSAPWVVRRRHADDLGLHEPVLLPVEAPPDEASEDSRPFPEEGLLEALVPPFLRALDRQRDNPDPTAECGVSAVDIGQVVGREEHLELRCELELRLGRGVGPSRCRPR
jgi:hypothetical protein